MKKALAIALTILMVLLLSAAVRGEALKKNIVPADASWVVHVNVEQLLGSRFFTHMMGAAEWAEVESKNAQFAKKFKINLLKDIQALTVYGKGNDEESAVACIAGRFDKDHLLDLLGMSDEHKEIAYGNYTMHNWDGDEYGAFVGNNLVLITKTEAGLKHALDVISGKADNITGSAAGDIIARTPSDSMLTAVARNISELLDREKDEHSAILKKAQAAMLHLSEREDDMVMGAEVAASSAKDADNIEQMLKGLLAMLDLYRDDLPSGIDIPEDIKISRAGNSVRVELSYPAEKLIKLIAEKGRFPFRFIAGVFSPFLP